MRGVLSAVRRGVLWLFLKIAEPRVIRIVQFALYVTMTVLGGIFLLDPPRSYEGILGVVLAVIFGSAIAGGGLLGALAVLPGRWWVERLGIIALWTGLGMYIVVATALGASSIGIAIAVCLALAFLSRWLQVRKYQVEPGR